MSTELKWQCICVQMLRWFTLSSYSIVTLQGVTRAQLLVQDFVLTQLIDKELCNIISDAVHNPMGVLADVLETEGRGLPEPRYRKWHSV